MRILLTGATGLVGRGVLQACLAAPDVERIVLLGRRHADVPADPRIEELLVDDFADLSPVADRLAGIDACFYCAGTLPLGSEATFRHVTVDLTVEVARALAQRNPALVFAYVSGAGSDPASALMPLRVKGEAERALQALPIRTVMLRPGAIQPVDGVRSPHPGRDLLYAIGGPVLGLGVRLLPNLATTTRHVGRAMLAVARMDAPPAVVENADILRLGD